MSLDSYLAKSHATYVEIRYSFDHEEVQQLYSLLKELGYPKFFDYVQQHQQDILKYISLSPSQRSQKKWVNRPDSLLFRFSALQISDATNRLISEIHPIADIVDRGSYREFHAAIPEGLAPLITGFPLSRFPFEGFENPFRPG